MIGQAVWPKRLVGLPGADGMGQAYLTERALVGSSAAVNVLDADITTNAKPVARFVNEARTAPP